MKKLVPAFLFIVGATASSQAQFQLLVTETPAGSVGPGSWMGVRRYNVAGTGGAAIQGNGIAASLVSDPAGLAVSSSGEIFVGNRHGNSNPSSISRFLYNSVTDTYVANGVVTGNSLFGTHGVALSASGELFASNVNGPISRFSPSGGGFVSNGTMSGGPSRDVFVSANQQWLYVSEGVTGNLLKYNIASGNLVNSFAISGAGGLHNGNWRGSDLYVAGFGSGTVHRISFDANGDVSGSSIVLSQSGPISLAFSPDGNEMFVAGHTSGVIERYLASGNSWNSNGSIATNVNMGDLQVVPEPATLTALGLGFAALLRRRRKD